MGWSLEEIIAYSDAHPDASLFDYTSKSNVMYARRLRQQGKAVFTGTPVIDHHQNPSVLDDSYGLHILAGDIAVYPVKKLLRALIRQSVPIDA